ncbi:hypothetical protein ZIOFF_031563 [Zingiber officinale]|uniref:Uncharacterized protein n=1 Tax=Zingiber officinale TaxID=94328 RepID=A0A8J5LAW5_ZINOF|nr:hypothetical protein ZIOFF_031563 [Zingiber officinale]
MQIVSEKASSLDLLSVVVASLSDGYGLDSGTGDAFVENRLLIVVLIIVIVVLVGCVAIFFVWRLSGRKPAEPSKPLVVKTQMDTEEDQGKKKALAEEAKARDARSVSSKFELIPLFSLDMEMASLLIMLPGSTNGLHRGKREEPGWKIFNLVAVVVDELLHEQGSKHIVQVGLGDDDQAIEDDFSAWRELLWPELDKLLQDENETGASTPYTAAILEYRVVFVKLEEVPYLDKSLSFANGHAIHDIQHPCSYSDGIANLLLQHTVLWKVAGKLIMPKPKGLTSEIKKAPSSGLKWSFSPGTNLLSGGAAKLEKESRQKLNEFSKELRTFRIVDLSGRNFGDDGLFFLLKALVTTAVGLKALDGVLQTNTMLKTVVSFNFGLLPPPAASDKALTEPCLSICPSVSRRKDLGMHPWFLKALELAVDQIYLCLGVGLRHRILIFSFLFLLCLSDILKVNGCIQKLQLNSSGKITLLDIGNNEIGPKGAFSIVEFVKKTKSLLWLNLYMNYIGDEVWLLTIVALCSVASLLKHKLSSKFTNLKYSRVKIDEVRF